MLTFTKYRVVDFLFYKSKIARRAVILKGREVNELMQGMAFLVSVRPSWILQILRNGLGFPSTGHH